MTSSKYGSLTYLHRSLDETGSRMFLYEDQSSILKTTNQNLEKNHSTVSKPNLVNVASSVSFAFGLINNKDRSTDDLQSVEARKIERIASLKSFVEQEQ